MKELSLLRGWLSKLEFNNMSNYWIRKLDETAYAYGDSCGMCISNRYKIKCYCRIIELHIAALCNDRSAIDNYLSHSIVFGVGRTYLQNYYPSISNMHAY